MKHFNFFRIFADGEPTANTTVKHLSLSSLPYEGKVGIGSFPTVDRRSNYSSSTRVYPSSLRGRIKVGLLLLLLIILHAPAWGYESATGTVVIGTKISKDNRFAKHADGCYSYRNGYSYTDGYGIKTQSNTSTKGGAVFYIGSDTEVTLTAKIYSTQSKSDEIVCSVYTITEDNYKTFYNGTPNSTNYTLNLTALTAKNCTISIPNPMTKDETYSASTTLSPGYYAISPSGAISNIFFYSLTFTSSSTCTATAPGDISKGSACEGSSLTLTAAGSPAANNTWYWQTSATGTDKTNSGATYAVSEAGTYYVRSYCSTGDGCWSDAKSIMVSNSDWTSAPANPTISCSNNSVTMSCATDGASIYYTTNNSTPTSSSTPYTSAITLTETKTFKAIAIKGDCSSEVVSQTCTYVAPCTAPTASWATEPANLTVGGADGSAKLTTNYPAGITWSSNPTGIVTITSDGVNATIHPVAAGTTTITATVTGDGTNICTGPATATKQITVSAPLTPTECSNDGHIFAYNDADRIKNGVRMNPLGNAIVAGATTKISGSLPNINVAGVTSVTLTDCYSEDKSSFPWMASYIKAKTKDSQGKITITLATGYTGTLTIYFGAYSSGNTSKVTNAANSATATSDGRSAETENSYTSKTLALASGDNVLTFSDNNAYISHMDIATVAPVVTTYTVTVAKNESEWGSVSQASVANVASGTSITFANTSESKLTVGTTDVTATPAAQTAQYDYAFTGWTSSDYTTDGTVTKDGTVTANFTRTTRQYTLTFDSKGGSSVASQTIDYNGHPTAVTAPTKDGYTFDGWSETDGGEVVADITTLTITGNKTLYAKWTENPGPTPTTVTAEWGYIQETKTYPNHFPNTGSSTINGVTITTYENNETANWCSHSCEGQNLNNHLGATIDHVDISLAEGKVLKSIHYSIYTDNCLQIIYSSSSTFDENETIGSPITLRGGTGSQVIYDLEVENANVHSARIQSIKHVANQVLYYLKVEAEGSQPEPTELTALESGTLYTIQDIVAAGCGNTLPASDEEGCYSDGISSNGMFEVIGNGTLKSGEGGTPESKQDNFQVGDYTWTSRMYFKGAATASNYVPTSRAVKFILPSAGKLEIWSKNGRYIILAHEGNGTALNSSDGNALSVHENLEAGTYYLYSNHSASTTLWGLRFTASSTPTLAAEWGYLGNGTSYDTKNLFTTSTTGGPQECSSTVNGVTLSTNCFYNTAYYLAKDVNQIPAIVLIGDEYSITLSSASLDISSLDISWMNNTATATLSVTYTDAGGQIVTKSVGSGNQQGEEHSLDIVNIDPNVKTVTIKGTNQPYVYYIGVSTGGSPTPISTAVTINVEDGIAGALTASSEGLNVTTQPQPKAHYYIEGVYTTDALATKVMTCNPNGSNLALVAGINGFTDTEGKWICSDATKTLYAKQLGNQYTINYKDQGDATYSGSNLSSLPAKHTYGQTTTLVDGVKEGYTFDGWYIEAACTNRKTELGPTDVTANGYTLYAKWTAQISLTAHTPGVYTTTYNASLSRYDNHDYEVYFGKCTSANEKYSVGFMAGKTMNYSVFGDDVFQNTDGTATDNWITINGYGRTSGPTNIDEWQKESGDWYHQRFKQENSNKLTLKVSGYDQFSIMFKHDNAKVTIDGNVSTTAETVSSYIVSRFDLDAQSEHTIIVEPASNKGDLHLAAFSLRLPAYTVTLDPQSGTGGSSSVSATYGVDMPSATMPTRTGYTFGGYYDQQNGAGTQYYTSAGASAHVWDKTSNTTLYAKWTEKLVTSITASPTSLDIKKGESADVELTISPADALDKEIKVTNASTTSSALKTGTTYTITGTSNGEAKDVTFENEHSSKQVKVSVSVYYEVAYEENGGSECTNGKYYKSGDVTLPTPEKSGFDFAGWYTDNNTFEHKYGDGGAKPSVSDNVTLYAKWVDATIRVTGVSLNKTATSIAVGGTETLTATIAPATATNKNVTWSSNNDKVTVNNGVVSVASDATVGSTATITVTTEDGDFTATCTVTVAAAPATSSAEWGYVGGTTDGVNTFSRKTPFPALNNSSVVDGFTLTNNASLDSWFAQLATNVHRSGSDGSGDMEYLACYSQSVDVQVSAPLDKTISAVNVAWTNFDNNGGLKIVFLGVDGTSLGEQAITGHANTERQVIQEISNIPDGTVSFKLVKTAENSEYNTNVSYIKVEATQTSPLYTITYNAGDAQGEMASVQAAKGRTFKLPKPQGFFYASHRFIGWKYSEDGSKTYNVGEEITMPAKSISFTALWEEVDFAKSIDFASLAASGPDIATTLVGSNYVMSSLENVSWDSQGYDADDTGLKTEYGDKEFSFWVQAYKQVTIQLGTWKGDQTTHTADFYLNGVKQTNPLQQLTANGPYTTTEVTEFTIEITNPFWSVLKKIDIDGTPQTISFDAGEGSGEKIDIDTISGEPYTLPTCPFTAPAGAEFAGWLCSFDNVIYAEGDSYLIPNEDVTFIAQWTTTCIAPTIKTQPTSELISKALGEAVSFGLVSDNADTYQWFTCNSTGGERTVIDGATSATYEFNAGKVGTYYYICEVKKNDCDKITSSTVVPTSIAPVDFTIQYTTGVSSSTTYTKDNITVAKSTTQATYITDLSNWTCNGTMATLDQAKGTGSMSPAFTATKASSRGENDYLEYTFKVKNGNYFIIEHIYLDLMRLNNGSSQFAIEVSDNHSHTFTSNYTTSGSTNSVISLDLTDANATKFVGDVKFRIYCWYSGVSVAFRIGPITSVTGKIYSLPELDDFTWTTAPADGSVGDADADILAKSATYPDATGITYSSNNTSVATIVNNKLHYVAGGEAYISATIQGDGVHYSTTTISQKITVIVPTTITTFTNKDGKGDGLWSTEDNWSDGIPDNTMQAIIAAPCSIPSIPAGVHAVAKSIKIDQAQSASIDIASTASLQVEGTIKRADGTPTEVSDIYIHSDAFGTGALVFNNSNGNKARVESYSLARQADNGSRYWQYAGVQTDNVDFNTDFYGAYTYLHQETNPAYWTRVKTGKAQLFKAYGITKKAICTYLYEGELAPTTTQEIALTYSDDGTRGINMVANSWTAPIDITKMETDDFGGAEATIYIYNTGNDSLQLGEDQKPTEGQWLSISVEAAKSPGYEGLSVIPAGQAFEVHTSKNATLTLRYDDVVRQSSGEISTEPMRSPARKGTDNYIDPQTIHLMRIRVAGQKVASDIYLAEDERFNLGYDNGWDAYFGGGDERTMMFYSVADNQQMTINALPTIEGTLLGFEPNADQLFTISFKYNGDATYYLNDIQEQKSTLISNDQTYMFMVGSYDLTHRFQISSTPYGSSIITGNHGAKADKQGAIKFIEHEHFFILNHGVLYDGQGKLVK